MITRSAALALAAILSGAIAAAEDDARPTFGGPNATERRIEEDAGPKKPLIRDEDRFLQPWLDFKARLEEERGITFGLEYSAVYLSASDSLGADDAAGGMLKFYGSLHLAGNRDSGENGAFVWKIEQRHDYGSPAPGAFALGDLGYVGLIEPPFSNQGFRTTNLYWRQRWDEGKTALVAGFLDTTDYVDVYGLASPWLHFMNFAFSTGSATIALPDDATLGVAAARMVTDQVYVIGGFADANANAAEPFDGVRTFFNDLDLFKHVEIGWTPSKNRIFFDNYHVTLWHKDKQKDKNIDDGWGMAFSFSRYVNDRWMPFVRGGYSSDGGTLLKRAIGGGVGWQPVPGRDLLGAGIQWGDPNEATFGPGLDDQITAEVFYRFQLSDEFAITADAQLLKDPALNPLDDTIWVLGVRTRAAF